MLMLSLMILLRVASASIPEITVVAALQLPASLNSATCCSGNKNGDELKCGYPLEGGDRLARSSAALGDIDGDGIPDVAVGSSRDGDGAKSGGAVYILHLNRDGTVKNTQKISAEFGMADKDTLNPLSKKGAFALEQEDRFGYSVGRIGDLDGDGIDDIVVGADGDDDGNTKGHDEGKQAAYGAVFVVFLNKLGRAKKIQKISNGVGGLAASTLGANDGFGQSANGIGDIDGDGIPDIAVGAPGGDERMGAVWLLCLNKDGTVKTQKKLDMGTKLDKSGGFGGRSIAVLSTATDTHVRLLIGASGADTHGAMWNVQFTKGAGGFGVVNKAVKISSNGAGGFPFSASATKSGTQTNTVSSEFGNSLSAIGDVDGDGIIDCAVSANNGGSAGKGILYLLTLKEDGTVKGGMEIDPDNLSADLKDGPLSALTVDANLPAEDRLCRSMSAPGMVAVAEGTKHGFSILCGAGAHGEFGGDMWLFSFTGQSEAAKKAVAVVTEGQEYCPPVAKGSGARRGVMHVLSWMMVMCAATLWW